MHIDRDLLHTVYVLEIFSLKNMSRISNVGGVTATKWRKETTSEIGQKDEFS